MSEQDDPARTPKPAEPGDRPSSAEPAEDDDDLRAQLMVSLVALTKPDGTSRTAYLAYLRELMSRFLFRFARGDLAAPQAYRKMLQRTQPFMQRYYPKELTPPQEAAARLDTVWELLATAQEAVAVVHEEEKLERAPRSSAEREVLKALFARKGSYVRRGDIFKDLPREDRRTEVRIGQILAGLAEKGLARRHYRRAQGGTVAFYAVSPSGARVCEHLRLDLPDELAAAATAYNTLKQADGGQVSEIAASPHFFLVGAREPFLDYATQLEAVVQTLELGRSHHLRTHPAYPSDAVAETESDTTLRRAVADCSRVLYLLPFCLTPRRTSRFGVIPFGKHRAIDVLLHNDHPSAQEMDLLQTSPIQWWTHLLHHTAAYRDFCHDRQGRSHPSALMTHGSFIAEIAQLLVAKTAVDESRTQFVRVHRQLHCAGRAGLIATVRRAVEDDLPSQVVVFDPVQRRQVADQLVDSQPKNFKIFRVQHGLDLPVGIGFSLYLLPSLLQDSRWTRLLEAMGPVLERESSEWVDYGIRIELAPGRRQPEVVRVDPAPSPQQTALTQHGSSLAHQSFKEEKLRDAFDRELERVGAP